MKEVINIDERIAIVKSLAETPAVGRVRHHCHAAHERVILVTDIPFLKEKLGDKVRPIKEGDDYPLCDDIDVPTSIACLHDPTKVEAIGGVIDHLHQNPQLSDFHAELGQMKNRINQYHCRLHRTGSMDNQIQEIRILEGFPRFGNTVLEEQLLNEHDAIIDDLFAICDRLNELLLLFK